MVFLNIFSLTLRTRSYSRLCGPTPSEKDFEKKKIILMHVLILFNSNPGYFYLKSKIYEKRGKVKNLPPLEKKEKESDKSKKY